jgi:SPOR domain/PilZ domain
MLEDRRQHLRVIPDRPLLARWGVSQSGFLCDLSEEGLGVNGLAPESPAEVITLAFDLPDGRGHIEARGEIAWTSDPQNRAGLHFVDLADTSREQLRKWISASVYTSELGIAETEPAEPPVSVTHGTDSADLLAQETLANEGLSRHRTSPYLTLFVLGALSLFSGVVFAHYYLGGGGNSWQGGKIMAAGKVPEVPLPGSIAPAKPSPAANPSLPPTLPLNTSGLVLQVAAMKHEDNADALAKTLQKRNFPAFVFKRGADPFYRVAVGVYSDPDSAATVKDQLKVLGFESILKPWSPV